MNNILNSSLKILGALCVILFVLASSLSLLLINGERKLFDAQSYLDALDAENFYDQLPGLVADTVTSSEVASVSSILGSFSAADAKKIVNALVPPDLIRSTTENTIVSFFDFLNGKSPQAVVPMTEIKAYVGGPQGLSAVQNFINSLPECTTEQMLDMAFSSFFGDEGILYLCSPPADLGDFLLRDFLQTGLQDAASAIPQQIVMLDSQNPAQAKWVSRVRAARLLMLASPILAFGFLILIVVFAVRSFREWFGWWGASFFLAGVFGLIVAALVNPLFSYIFQKSLLPRFPFPLPASVTVTLRDVFGSILSKVAAPIAIESILIGLLGIVLLLATRFFKPAAPIITSGPIPSHTPAQPIRPVGPENTTLPPPTPIPPAPAKPEVPQEETPDDKS